MAHLQDLNIDSLDYQELCTFFQDLTSQHKFYLKLDSQTFTYLAQHLKHSHEFQSLAIGLEVPENYWREVEDTHCETFSAYYDILRWAFWHFPRDQLVDTNW